MQKAPVLRVCLHRFFETSWWLFSQLLAFKAQLGGSTVCFFHGGCDTFLCSHIVYTTRCISLMVSLDTFPAPIDNTEMPYNHILCIALPDREISGLPNLVIFSLSVSLQLVGKINLRFIWS